MIFKLLGRITKRQAGAHVWVPIVVVALLSVLFEYQIPHLGDGRIDWIRLLQDLRHSWRPLFVEHWRELAGIYLAFIWIVSWSVKKASDVRWTMIGDLYDNLDGATRYFALGTIPLREWFEPNTLLYLATIIEYQLRCSQPGPQGAPPPPRFRHERVLPFYRDSDLKALQASYLDQHYATSFSAIHDRFKVPLAYLKSDDLAKLLARLSAAERWILADYRWFARPRRLWNQEGLKRLAKNTERLRPFALVEHAAGEKVVLGFTKHGNNLIVQKIEDPVEKAACEKMVGFIDEVIYKAGTTELLEHCKFSRYLNP